VRLRRQQADDVHRRVIELEGALDDARREPGLWVARRVSDELGLTVRSGPFAGLRYVEEAVGAPHLADCLPAKLLGSYERELHPALERLLQHDFGAIVNVGAAEGYYAVGLALRTPEARVWAFETDPGRRDLCRELARANGVDARVEIAGECDAGRLAVFGDDCLVVMDCEGCEVNLLGEPSRALASSSLIVELHDAIEPRSTRSVEEAFGETHAIELIDARPRYAGDFPELDFLGWNNRELAISETRTHPTRWAVVTPRGGPGS
jgi:hypothetical protein